MFACFSVFLLQILRGKRALKVGKPAKYFINMLYNAIYTTGGVYIPRLFSHYPFCCHTGWLLLFIIPHIDVRVNPKKRRISLYKILQ